MDAGTIAGRTASIVAHGIAFSRLCHVRFFAVKFHAERFSAAAAAETSSTAAPHPSSSGRYDHKSGSRPDANAPRRDQISTGVSALDQNRTWSTANAARPGPPTVPKGIGIPASATAPRYAPSAYNRTDAPGATYGTPSGTATNARCVHSRIGAEWLNIFAEVSAATTRAAAAAAAVLFSAEANAARAERVSAAVSGTTTASRPVAGAASSAMDPPVGPVKSACETSATSRRTHASTVHGGFGTVVFSSTKGAVKDDPKSPASTRAYTPCGGGHPSAASRAARSFSCSASVCRALPIMCAECSKPYTSIHAAATFMEISPSASNAAPSNQRHVAFASPYASA